MPSLCSQVILVLPDVPSEPGPALSSESDSLGRGGGRASGSPSRHVKSSDVQACVSRPGRDSGEAVGRSGSGMATPGHRAVVID